jgi:hypothetical protein
MDRLPGASADRIYSVLIKYAEASQNYYDKELFAHLFSVIRYGPKKYRLKCMDDKSRFFIKSNGEFKYSGPRKDFLNSIIRKIIKEEIEKRNGVSNTHQ